VTPEQIRELRDRLGFTRRELAAQLGVSKRTVEFWEQGRGNPNCSAEKILESLEDDQ
jgi:DNA-binding transcriptional regulator YiaG